MHPSCEVKKQQIQWLIVAVFSNTLVCVDFTICVAEQNENKKQKTVKLNTAVDWLDER